MTAGSGGKGDPLYFGARASAEAVRLSSSSGGIFFLLASRTLEEGGCVYGAAMERGGHVRHRAAAAPDQLAALQKSKYVQSEIGLVFRQVREQLEQGMQVLFSGTPCQGRGLQLFLQREYDNLLTVDLICNGVGSPGIWERYAALLERRSRAPLERFSFRDKRNGDSGHTVSLNLGGREYARPSYADPYCALYFQNRITRPACHRCPFCAPERSSDLTIGDFWGVSHVAPEFDDGMGVSLVLVHTSKGRRAWERICGQLDWFACGRDQALQPEQPRLRAPAAPSSRRMAEMALYRLLPFPLWIGRKGRLL